ncbi:PREDICTED: MRG/MORF4L-binding protein-like [Priapulus caudatus]|uniref:MRG/MORF4L-binding protein-like n=1 Tax=Priapulus caudatus TaxID=37621 RepID=A0ABM1DNG2_PRICU|nr:PREDICTED: MRG/MORF4L-binding protein-like [Priapulus caudatus]
MAGDVGESGDVQSINWTAEVEVSLFHAMRGHKPVGVNKHWQMACIQDKFSNAMNMKITAEQIWQHLGTMYDLQALHDSEIIPFPVKEVDFNLPQSEFGEQMKDKQKGAQKGKETPGKEKKEKNKDTPKEKGKDTVKEKGKDTPKERGKDKDYKEKVKESPREKGKDTVKEKTREHHRSYERSRDRESLSSDEVPAVKSLARLKSEPSSRSASPAPSDSAKRKRGRQTHSSASPAVTPHHTKRLRRV